MPQQRSGESDTDWAIRQDQENRQRAAKTQAMTDALAAAKKKKAEEDAEKARIAKTPSPGLGGAVSDFVSGLFGKKK